MVLVVKNLPDNNTRDARDKDSIPGLGRSPEEGNGNPLQYSRLENSMDRGAWRAIVHGVARVGHDLETETPPVLSNIVHVVATSLLLQMENFFIHFLWLSSTPLYIDITSS